MARLVTLGTAAAVPDEKHANTYLAVEGEGGFFLVDCADSPLVRLRKAGLEPDRLRGLIITHFHPDHVFGAPILLMDLWLLGRSDPLPIYGPEEAVGKFRAMMSLFDWERWRGLFSILFHAVAEEVGALVVESEDFRVTAAPAKHLVPTIALRFEHQRTGGVAVYSSDTAPCDTVVELARGAGILLHEAAQHGLGHSSPAQAGEVARRAGVGRLMLVHYPPDPARYDLWRKEAAAAFGGPVELARDFSEYFF